MTKLQKIQSHAPANFDEPVIIETPIPVRIYSIEKTEAGEVMVQVNDGSFHKLEETDRNYDVIADAILQRMKNKSIIQMIDLYTENNYLSIDAKRLLIDFCKFIDKKK